MYKNSEALLVVVQDTTELLLGAPYESKEYMLLAITGLVIIALIGKMLNALLAGSTRGIIATFIGLMLPILIGITGYSFAKLYGADFIPDTQILHYICLGAGAGLAFFTLVIIAPFFLGVGVLKTLLVFTLTMAATCTGLYFTSQGVDAYFAGENSYKKSSYVDQITFD